MKTIRLVLLLALAAVALWLVLRDLYPGSEIQRARAAREWARAEEARAEADAARAWSVAWADLADERAAALTWGLVGAVTVILAAALRVVIGLPLRE